ncbi:hypothetical protein EHQ86_00315 [Leptospira yasudae]|nr:hypothetical protein EHQ86_00315 [Leptospira yasudae]
MNSSQLDDEEERRREFFANMREEFKLKVYYETIAPTCKCGAPMVRKKFRNGEFFWGCTRYSDDDNGCKERKNIKDADYSKLDNFEGFD